MSLLEYVCMVVSRVAELGSLSSGEEMDMKIFVKRVFTIFATNASFLCVIAQKVRKSQQILIRDKIAYVRA